MWYAPFIACKFISIVISIAFGISFHLSLHFNFYFYLRFHDCFGSRFYFICCFYHRFHNIYHFHLSHISFAALVIYFFSLICCLYNRFHTWHLLNSNILLFNFPHSFHSIFFFGISLTDLLCFTCSLQQSFHFVSCTLPIPNWKSVSYLRGKKKQHCISKSTKTGIHTWLACCIVN